MKSIAYLAMFASLLLCAGAFGQQPLFRFEKQEIDRTLKVGYSVIIADVNNDKKPDIVVADAQRVIWFENPSWKMHTIIQGQTKPDNVSIAAHDIDGDGLIDFALAADWKPFNTKSGGTLQWLKRGKTLDEPWSVHPISDNIPTIHRIRFGALNGDGKPMLVAAPLMGRETTAAKNWSELPTDICIYPIPQDPARDRWLPKSFNRTLTVVHNFDIVDLEGNGFTNMLAASYEGVTRIGYQPSNTPDKMSWRTDHLCAGDQSDPKKNRGASEVRLGRLKDKQPIIATIEPWHGNQVVVYEPINHELSKPWKRTVIDKDLKWGHALAWADLDGDGQDELIAGVRDTLNPQHPCGVRIYRLQADKTWKMESVDPGGVAVEDLVVADLNSDGKPDIIAVGRATGNVRIYWNQTNTPR